MDRPRLGGYFEGPLNADAVHTVHSYENHRLAAGYASPFSVSAPVLMSSMSAPVLMKGKSMMDLRKGGNAKIDGDSDDDNPRGGEDEAEVQESPWIDTIKNTDHANERARASATAAFFSLARTDRPLVCVQCLGSSPRLAARAAAAATR